MNPIRQNPRHVVDVRDAEKPCLLGGEVEHLRKRIVVCFAES